MKKYYVIMTVGGMQWGGEVLARSEQVARNKAIRRAERSLKQTVTQENVVSVEYLGFYLARRFYSVRSI